MDKKASPSGGGKEPPNRKHSVKESERPRFEPIVASISFNKDGREVYGLPEVPCRKQLWQQYEADKAAECEAAIEQMQAPPRGRWTEAREELYQTWAQREAAAETLVAPKSGPIGRHLVTSHDNLLGCGAGYYSAPGVPEARQAAGVAGCTSLQAATRPESKRTFAGEEMRAARDHLATSTLVPVEEEEQAQQEEAREQGMESRLRDVAAALELRQRLSREYPHGIPRLVLAQLRQSRVAEMADLLPLDAASA
ncbi:hypothetical protein HYH03_002480 [Edaphochlamys debaryana]|uniref:Uncharacterized protein n=1 Tax=Edaphochlamys debaryana TaxID=47281 RepID=A0A835YKU7_9CHLO|nr:hypothetical protein HYH03_002480 [Edaphochlamys debaryana]|eukprot:KAG2499534.1 hypothetical protein HYH03_002480 [Edaphochlamys debaryana]